MAKRTQPPPTAMPTGQVFRRSAKKQKVTTASAPSVDAVKGKATVRPTAKGKQKASEQDDEQAAGQPKSILKKNGVKGQDRNVMQKAAGRSSPGTTMDKERGKGKQAVLTSTSTNEGMLNIHKLAPSKSFRIIVGSYERLLFGFHVKLSAHGDLIPPTFTPLFSFAAHTSCITSVAAAGPDSKWLATGAGDETVRVWDLRKRKEVGALTGHGGTIHSLSFPMRTYLLSADSSGLINLYRTRDWALLKTMRGHTGRVNACVAHPSGKVALSVGQDGMLRMWDLMRGKGAGAVRLDLGRSEEEEQKYSSRVKEEPLDVQWSPNGTRFVVMGRTEVVVFKTDMTRVASVLVRRDDPKHKFGSVAWLDSERIMAGTEHGIVDVYQVGKDSLKGPICKLVGHGNRVKALRAIHVQPTAEHDMTLAVTACSDGKLRIYDLSDLSDSSDVEERKPMAVHSTGGARLTCLDVVGGAGVRTAATDTAETDVEEDDSNDDEEGGSLVNDTDDHDDESDLDDEEMQELNGLLDLLDEARAQGIDVEGMSDFAGSDQEADTDGDSEDDDFDAHGEEENDEEEEEEDDE